MTDEYWILLEEGSDEYIVQKSRFICDARPVQTEEEALSFLQDKRQRYRDATHHCYAYVIGENAGIIRYSDDGEPGGTAGLPMMEVIRARQVVNCAVVITRYFGGILLGAGGLVRAYSRSCAMALDKAGVAKMCLSQRMMVSVPYPLWDKVNYLLGLLPVRTEETAFGQNVDLVLLMKEKDADMVLSRLTQETSARAEAILMDQCFAPWKD